MNISEGVAGQYTLPHTDQAGFIDESGNAYTNWYYTARVTYSTPSKAKNKAPKVKVFQLTTGQTDVDLDLLPAGAPALPYIAPTATVTAFGGRTGPVTLEESDLPARLADTELNATYGPDAAPMRETFTPRRTEQDNVIVATSNTIGLNEFPGFFIFGVNIGIHNTDGTANYYNMWTSQWSNAWIDDSTDKIAALGANVIRIMGVYSAYAAGPAAYKQKFVYAMERARMRGLKVIFALINTGTSGELVGMEYAAGYQAMVNDLVGEYAGDNLILGWDVANEFTPDVTPGHVTIIQTMSGYVKAVDPQAKVTAGLRLLEPAAVKAIDAYVDFHDVHHYEPPTPTLFPSNHILDKIKWVTAKPIIVGEVGANYALGGNSPVIPGRLGQAQYLAAFRKYAVGDFAGIIIHKIVDTGTLNKFGLYDDNGVALPILGEALKYPTSRLTVVRDVVDTRSHPVVVDNFARPASATVVGTSPIGGTPVQGRGTWGINGSNQLYVSTPDGSGRNALLWEANTADVTAEVEFVPYGAGRTRAGLLLRYVDANNWLSVVYDNTQNPQPGLSMFQSVAGTVTNITPPITPGGAVGDIGQGYMPAMGRVKVTMRGSVVNLYVFDKMVARTTVLTQFQTATKHGIYSAAPTDQGTLFHRLRILVDGRSY
jgi:hypothetical protein